MINVDFNRDRFEGQLNPEERKSLYDLIIREKPKTVCEVGTCRGGGTTYYISSAIHNNHESGDVIGELYTCEYNAEFYKYALNLYSGVFQQQSKYVNFNFGHSEQVYRQLLGSKINSVNICVLDGGADSMQMLYDYTMFRPFIPIGGYLVCHDWDNGKTDYMRKIIPNDNDWQLESLTIALTIHRRIGDVHNQCT